MTDEFAISILEQYREKPTLINEIETVEEAVWLDEALDMAIKALEQQSMPTMVYPQVEGITPVVVEPIPKLPPVNQQEPCEDAISRKSLKHKLQEHHDFFVNAYGGFSNLPQNDKSRVDEISNCIAMVVNEPPVNPQPKTGHWIKYGKLYQCSECEELSCCQGKFCNECGAKMFKPQEGSDKV